MGMSRPFQMQEQVVTSLPNHQRAFLDAIAGGESGGRYNIRYTPRGGATFDSFDRHPGIMERGPHGPSSAAGRYQFTRSTWDSLMGADTPFTPENQDRAALMLAAQRYRARTGRDLDTDLQSNGLTPQIMQALAPTWQAFNGNHARHIATYNAALGGTGNSMDPNTAGPSSTNYAQRNNPPTQGETLSGRLGVNPSTGTPAPATGQPQQTTQAQIDALAKVREDSEWEAISRAMSSGAFGAAAAWGRAS